MLPFKKQISICIATLCLLIASKGIAQTSTQKLGVGIHPFTGFVWAHKKEIDNLKAPIYGSSIDIRVKTANRKYWHRKFHQPFWGVRLYYAYLGNPDITGSVYGILPYIELPVIKKQKWQWNLRGSTGLGYVTKPFNSTNNPKNGTVGSFVNANMGAHGVISIFLTNQTELTLMGGITHFSNGNIKLPNLGLNLPDATIGLAHYIKNTHVERTEPKKFEDSKHEYSLIALGGSKNINHLFSTRVIPVSIQLRYGYSVSSTSKLGGGVDFFYDEGNLFSEQRKEREGFANAFETGIKASYELKISRLSFMCDLGAYVYNKNKSKRAIYQQVGLKWQASENIFLYSILKAHFDSADYFGFGAGCSIFKD